MKKLVLALFVALTGIQLTHAKPINQSSSWRGDVNLICVTEDGTVAGNTTLDDLLYVDLAIAAGPMCKDIEHYSNLLNGTALGLQVVSFGLACTGIGSPGTVLVSGAGLAVKVVEFYVKNIPCEKEPEKIQEEAIKSVMCAELKRNGIECLPERLEIRQK